jgi:uncharacterized protein (TIGR00266 family)
MQSTISGEVTPALSVTMSAGESLYAQSGAMMYLTGDIEWNAEMKGGLMGGLKRMVSGESLFLTTYQASGQGGVLGLAPPYPSQLHEIDLRGGREVVAERGAFLAATSDVEVEVAFQKKLGAGFLGGEGFVLQRLKGEGTAWVHAGGTFVEFDLQPGQTIKVDTGCIVWYDSTVNQSIERAGGIKKSLFGGEGLFLATLTGPGHVALQTMPFGKMAQAIIGGAMTGKENGGVLGNLGSLGGLLE